MGILILLLPLLIEIIIVLYYFIKSNKTVLSANTLVLDKITDGAKDIIDSKVENITVLSEKMPSVVTAEFGSAWLKVTNQSKTSYNQGILPKASSFFDVDRIINIPARRDEVKSLWFVAVFLMLMSVMLPYSFDVIRFGESQGSFVLGFLCASAIALIQIIFYISNNKTYAKAMASFNRFLDEFDRVIPTANDLDAPALLLEAVNRNQLSFELMTKNISDSFLDNTNRITSSIDAFTKEAVVPVLSESFCQLTKEHITPILADISKAVNSTMRELMRQQESGVKELAESFAQQLAETLKIRIESLSENLTDYQNRVEKQDSIFETRMNEQNAAFENRIDTLNTSLSQSQIQIEKLMEMQSSLLEKSVLSYDRMALLMESEQKNKEEMQLDLKKTSDSIAILKDQIQSFVTQSLDFSNNSLSVQQRFGEIVDGMTENIHSAMESAGKEIAGGINKAVADNAKAIEDLTVQSQLLRDDYGRFFDQRDESTKQTIEDMDYQIQGMIGRMSEDIGTILDKAVRENGEILAQYSGNAASVARSFEEQAMSLNIYAKEIHSDIAGLSENLNTSVEKFSSDIKEGIEFVFTDFDKGMAELTRRISDTVESINDSVENLSNVLKR